MNNTLSVLVCGAENGPRLELARHLQNRGYSIFTAEDTTHAMGRLRGDGVDAVVTDVHLRHGNAFDLLGEIRRVGVDVPVLMISGYATPVMRTHAQEKGVARLFEKPVDPDEVARAVGECIAKSDEDKSLGRVLLVEDHPMVRSLMKVVLEREGFEVLVAEDGTRALDLLRGADGPVDMALVDCHTPGPSGAELIGKLRGIRPGLYVALMTGEADHEELRDGYKAGAVTLFRKPCSPAKVAHAMRRNLVEARRMREDVERRERRERRASELPLYKQWLRSASRFMRKRGRLHETGIVAAGILLVFALALGVQGPAEELDSAKKKTDGIGAWLENARGLDAALMNRLMEDQAETLRKTRELEREMNKSRRESPAW